MTKEERKKQQNLYELKNNINKTKDLTFLYKSKSLIGIVSSFAGLSSYIINSQDYKLIISAICTGYTVKQLANLVDNKALLEELRSELARLLEDTPRLSLTTHKTLH